MTIGESLRKIQALPEAQRKTIFIILMTLISLVAVFLVTQMTRNNMANIPSSVNVPTFSPTPSIVEDVILQEDSVMIDTGRVTPRGRPEMLQDVSSSSEGFDPNQVFNVNQ